jgi:hypothetical protein
VPVTGLGDAAAAAVMTVGAALVMVTVDEGLVAAYAVACTMPPLPAATGAVYNPVAALTYPMPLASDQKEHRLRRHRFGKLVDGRWR